LALVEVSVVEQRYQAVLMVQSGAKVTEVAARFEVSRQAVHAWLRAYRDDVPERSRWVLRDDVSVNDYLEPGAAEQRVALAGRRDLCGEQFPTLSGGEDLRGGGNLERLRHDLSDDVDRPGHHDQPAAQPAAQRRTSGRWRSAGAAVCTQTLASRFNRL
jgi:Homeodomain-like domain